MKPTEAAPECLAHARDISIRTYGLGDQTVLVEGTLKDHRHRSRKGETLKEPNLVHHMVARFKIKGPELVIIDAEAEMPCHPREECEKVLSGIQQLVGEMIKAGFTIKVKELIGNSRGCAHLTNLFLTMAPAAVQGYWVAYGRVRSDVSLQNERIKAFVNTCYLWREDGPLVESLKNRKTVKREGG